MGPGDKLANGALVIAIDNNVVLALWVDSYHPYVTWNIDAFSGLYAGHYFDNIVPAATDYDNRVNGRL